LCCSDGCFRRSFCLCPHRQSFRKGSNRIDVNHLQKTFDALPEASKVALCGTSVATIARTPKVPGAGPGRPSKSVTASPGPLGRMRHPPAVAKPSSGGGSSLSQSFVPSDSPLRSFHHLGEISPDHLSQYSLNGLSAMSELSDPGAFSEAPNEESPVEGDNENRVEDEYGDGSMNDEQESGDDEDEEGAESDEGLGSDDEPM
jgi:hypothetical protein